MSLKATIANAVDSVFAAVGDMVSTITLHKENYTSYDWASGAYTGSSSSITCEAIFVEGDSSSGEPSASPLWTVVIRTPDLGVDFSFYKTITRDGTSYTIDSLEQYEGATVLKVRS